ncbi:MAG: M1 family aminopeptidase [Acidobacteriota bacterium]
MTRSLFALSLLVVLMTGSAAASSLSNTFYAIEEPVVGEPFPWGDGLEIGRAKITPKAGAQGRLLWAAGEPVGVWLAGGFDLRYAIDDRFSAQVARRNFRTASSLAPRADGDGLTAAMALQGAVLWSWDLGREQAEKQQATAPEESAGSLPSWLSKALEDPFFESPAANLLAFRHLGRPGGQVALLHGSEDWLLVVDPVVDREERLYRLDSLNAAEGGSDFKGSYVGYDLAAQPIGRNWWDRPQAPCVTTSTRLTIENPGDRLVKVSSRLEVQATRGGLGIWRVSLRNWMFYDSKQHPITVSSVKVNGESADYVHDRGELFIRFPQPLSAGQTAVVEVENQGNMAYRPNNDSYWSLGTWPWYPQPPLNGEFSQLEIELRVPQPFTPYASGKTVERTSGDGFSRVKTRLDKPMQFPVVVAGKYTEVASSMNGIDASVAAYAGGKERASKQLLKNFHAAADYYSKLFGVPLPFTEMNVVEINSWGFGQAPPGVIFITREAYDPIGNITSRFFSQGVNERYVHEVAHSWWGHVIKMDSLEEQWLTESFAEYSAALALQAMRGGGKKGQREFDKLLRQWQSRAREIDDGGSIYLANRLSGKEDRDFRDRTFLLYAKGPLVLHALRQELAKQYGSAEQGDRYFFALLRTLTTNFNVQFGETRHLVGILNEITQKDWQPWFEKYVYGTEMPKLK